MEFDYTVGYVINVETSQTFVFFDETIYCYFVVKTIIFLFI